MAEISARYQHRQEAGAGATPTTLLPGEIAINTTDEDVWIGKADGTPKSLFSFTKLVSAIKSLIGSSIVAGTGITKSYDSGTGLTTLSASAAASAAAPGLYLYLFGDSRSYQATSYTTTVPGPRAASPFWWAEALSQCVTLDYRYNQGVSGDEVGQLKTRIESNTANAYGFGPDDLPEPGVVSLLIGTNDITGAVAAGGKTYIDTVLTNHLWIVNWCLGKGHKVVVWAEWPRGGLSADEQKLMQYYARKLRLQYLNMANVFVIDIWPEAAIASDTTGAAIAGLLNADELHTSPGIGQLAGRHLAYVLVNKMGLPVRQRRTGTNADVYDAALNPRGNIAGNPMLRGTAGTLGSGATGVAPDGWTLDASSGLAVVGSQETIVVNGTLRDAYKMVISGNATANNAYARLRRSGLISSINAGDILEANCEVLVDNGHVNFGAPAMVIDPGVTADQVHGGLTVTGDRSPPAAIVEGFYAVPRSERYTTPGTPPASMAVDYRVRFVQGDSGTPVASSATIYFLSTSFRKTNV